MDKTSKVISIILGIIAVILFGTYLFLTNVNKSIPKDLVYPDSGLSQSIFDSQNTKYNSNPNYTKTASFSNCPYSYDIAPTDSAKVSELGKIYRISDSMYFYTTEYKKDENIESILRNELSQAVMVDSNSSMTAIDNYVYDEGYLNGFKADYYIDGMTVTNGSRTVSVYITGYALTITDPSYDHGYKMFIGVMAGGNDTDTYADGKSIVDSVVGTFRYNSDVQGKLVNAEIAAKKAEEQARKEAEKQGLTYVPSTSAENSSQDNLIVSTDGSTTDLAANANTQGTMQQGQATVGNATTSGQALTQANEQWQQDNIKQDAYLNNQNNNAVGTQGDAATAQIPQQKTKSMTLDTEYSGVTLYYYYENVDSQLTVTLVNPSGSQSYQPVSMEAGTIIFKLDKMEPGKWQVLINGDAGTDSMKLYSEDMASSEEGQ